MKKLVFVINNLYVGGAERVFVDDANYFHNIGVNVYFLILYGDIDKNPLINNLKIPNENIIFLNASNILDFNLYKNFYNFIKNIKNCTVYSTLNDANFVSRIVLMFFHKIFLVTREANTTENKSILLKIFDLLMNFRVNKMVAVSEEVKKSIISYQPWVRSKVVVLYNGVDIPEIVNRKSNGMNILAVGSLTPKKAHNILIDAFSMVIRKNKLANLHIIGGGILKDNLERQALENGTKNNVHLLGEKKYGEVIEYYKNSDIFVLPSNQEGCPNALLEAMSYGLPSIATNVGAVSEIINDGISGFIISKQNSKVMADVIIKLFNSSELRKKIGDLGRDKIVSHFSRDQHVSQLKKILSL